MLVVTLILGVGWAMDRLLIYDGERKKIQSEQHFLQGSFLYIKSIFGNNPQNIPETWSRQHLKLQTELGYPLAIYHLSDFSGIAQLSESLLKDPIVALSSENEGIIYYSQLNNTDYIIALGPIQAENRELSFDVMLVALYHLFIASVLFLWFAPLARDLQKLREVASNFGAENFSARIKLGKNSSIALVADAFNGMAQRIQTLVSAHKELTHAVSHELKTPLARFKFSLEIIEGLEDDKKRRLYLHAMKQDVRELDGLIDEMLSYAQLDAQNLQLNRQEIYAQAWLKDFESQYSKENKIKISFSLTTDLPQPALLIDRHLMDRAVNNLIRNGFRHAERELKVSLNISEYEVKLTVSDDGQGIAKQDREKVFQPFIRLESSRDKQSGGYGLGLAIAKKIIQQHGGTLTVGASMQGGAEFFVSWPVRA